MICLLLQGHAWTFVLHAEKSCEGFYIAKSLQKNAMKPWFCYKQFIFVLCECFMQYHWKKSILLQFKGFILTSEEPSSICPIKLSHVLKTQRFQCQYAFAVWFSVDGKSHKNTGRLSKSTSDLKSSTFSIGSVTIEVGCSCAHTVQKLEFFWWAAWAVRWTTVWMLRSCHLATLIVGAVYIFAFTHDPLLLSVSFPTGVLYKSMFLV